MRATTREAQGNRAAEFFTLIGVIGASVTILAIIEEMIPLAPWTQAAIEIWQFASELFWRLVGQLLNLVIEKWMASVLTFCAFILFTSLGVRLASSAPKLSLWGVLGRFILLAAAAILLAFAVSALFLGPLGLAPGREQGATLLAMAAIYAPMVSLVVWLTKRNRSGGARYSWATIALSSGVALLFALSILANASLSADIRLLLFSLVFGILSGFAIAAPLLLAPHQDLFRRYVAIYGVVALILGLSEATKLSATIIA